MTPVDRNKILIVDDEPMVRMALKAVLSFYLPGYEVDEAENGEEGVNAFLDARHGVLLMDLQMPVMDGISAFKEIQESCANEESEMPSILFCTAYAPSDEIQELIATSPSHGLLQKPVTNDHLVEQVKQRLDPAPAT